MLSASSQINIHKYKEQTFLTSSRIIYLSMFLLYDELTHEYDLVTISGEGSS